MDFKQAINQFTQLSIQELISKIENDNKVIAFLGRETCSFCRKFAPKLAQASLENDWTVYFVASDMLDDMTVLAEFREVNTIPTVPALIVANQGQIRTVCNSALSEEAIKAFIEG